MVKYFLFDIHVDFYILVYITEIRNRMPLLFMFLRSFCSLLRWTLSIPTLCFWYVSGSMLCLLPICLCCLSSSYVLDNCGRFNFILSICICFRLIHRNTFCVKAKIEERVHTSGTQASTPVVNFGVVKLSHSLTKTYKMLHSGWF